MKANELRIGNYIRNEVQGINFQVNSVVIHRLCFGDSEGYSPIELTEEILLKCADIENRNTNPKSYYLHNRIIFINDNICYDYATRVKLPYLHTFQNFIFALIGEELNVQL